MALTKQTVVDKVEVTEDGIVQVRTAVRIVEDGVLISVAHHRHTIQPGKDFSGEDPKVQAICSAVHTGAVIAAYQSMLEKIESERLAALGQDETNTNV